MNRTEQYLSAPVFGASVSRGDTSSKVQSVLLFTTTCWDKFGTWYIKSERHTCQTCSALASRSLTHTHTLLLLCYKGETCMWSHLYIRKCPSTLSSLPLHPYYSHQKVPQMPLLAPVLGMGVINHRRGLLFS